MPRHLESLSRKKFAEPGVNRQMQSTDAAVPLAIKALHEPQLPATLAFCARGPTVMDRISARCVP